MRETPARYRYCYEQHLETLFQYWEVLTVQNKPMSVLKDNTPSHKLCWSSMAYSTLFDTGHKFKHALNDVEC